VTLRSRWRRWPRPRTDVSASNTLASSCLVFERPLQSPRQLPATQPLSFTVLDVPHGLATSGAAVATRVPRRTHGGFETTRPTAQIPGKKCELRDHAPTQPVAAWLVETQLWLGDGASAPLRRAGLSRPHPAADSPAAAQPATGELRAGSLDPGSTAGSIAEERTCGHTLCADRSATEVVGLWHGSGSLVYRGERPRERASPKGSPGRMLTTFSPGVDQNGNQTNSLKRPQHKEQDADGNRFTQTFRRKRQEGNEGKETVLEM
jgi:hypothetical protein